jgi:hypothetical protein
MQLKHIVPTPDQYNYFSIPKASFFLFGQTKTKEDIQN